MYIYTSSMNTPLTPQSLIEEILQIQRMEHGSLSIIRRGPNGPYYNLNSWENGKNCCRYLPQDKVPEVQRAIAAYQHKPGWQRKARAQLTLDCIFGFFTLERDYYYHPGKQQGHYPADAALGLEGSCTPALARLVCLEGADEASYQKAQEHLKETGGIAVSARQIQRLVQSVGPGAQAWQEREALVPLPGTSPAPIMYLSG